MNDVDAFILGISDELDTEKYKNIRIINPGDCMLPKRSRDSHKGTYGRAGFLSGSRGMAGAAVLNLNAALRCGSGIVKGCIPSSVYSVVESMSVEAITYPFDEDLVSVSDIKKELVDFSDVVATGSGCTNLKNYGRLLDYLLEESPKPLVIDAEGINLLTLHKLKYHKQDIVLTPHYGEMSRLVNKDINQLRKDIDKTAAEFASLFRVYLVLKGARTLVACPDGTVFINTSGNPGMATAGSGDVLTGVIASFIGQKIEINKAIALGVYVHGVAGDMAAHVVGEYSLIAGDIIRYLPDAVSSVTYK